MEVREIHYLKACGLPIADFHEAVTPATPDHFVHTDQYFEEMIKIIGKEYEKYHKLFKECAYTSCTMLFALTAFNTKTIDKDKYTALMEKAKDVLQHMPKPVITLTILYEHYNCLTPEILEVYSAAGHTDIVNTFLDIFVHEFETAQKDHIAKTYVPHPREDEMFQPIYDNFMKWDYKNLFSGGGT